MDEKPNMYKLKVSSIIFMSIFQFLAFVNFVNGIIILTKFDIENLRGMNGSQYLYYGGMAIGFNIVLLLFNILGFIAVIKQSKETLITFLVFLVLEIISTATLIGLLGDYNFDTTLYPLYYLSNLSLFVVSLLLNSLMLIVEIVLFALVITSTKFLYPSQNEIANDIILYYNENNKECSIIGKHVEWIKLDDSDKMNIKDIINFAENYDKDKQQNGKGTYNIEMEIPYVEVVVIPN